MRLIQGGLAESSPPFSVFRATLANRRRQSQGVSPTRRLTSPVRQRRRLGTDSWRFLEESHEEASLDLCIAGRDRLWQGPGADTSSTRTAAARGGGQAT